MRSRCGLRNSMATNLRYLFCQPSEAVYNQQINSADSGNSKDHHEKTDSHKTSSPHHQEDSNANFPDK